METNSQHRIIDAERLLDDLIVTFDEMMRNAPSIQPRFYIPCFLMQLKLLSQNRKDQDSDTCHHRTLRSHRGATLQVQDRPACGDAEDGKAGAHSERVDSQRWGSLRGYQMHRTINRTLPSQNTFEKNPAGSARPGQHERLDHQRQSPCPHGAGHARQSDGRTS
jgi:hypothetical protein